MSGTYISSHFYTAPGALPADRVRTANKSEMTTTGCVSDNLADTGKSPTTMLRPDTPVQNIADNLRVR